MIFETRSNKRRWALRCGFASVIVVVLALLVELLLGVFTNPSFRTSLHPCKPTATGPRNVKEFEPVITRLEIDPAEIVEALFRMLERLMDGGAANPPPVLVKPKRVCMETRGGRR